MCELIMQDNAMHVADYENYIERLEHRGIPLTSYPCPDCHAPLASRIPAKRDVYDSMVVCPYCRGYHYRHVFHDGHVDITQEEQA